MSLNLFRQLLRAAPDFIQEQDNFLISMAEDAIRAVFRMGAIARTALGETR